MRQGNMGVDR